MVPLSFLRLDMSSVWFTMIHILWSGEFAAFRRSAWGLLGDLGEFLTWKENGIIVEWANIAQFFKVSPNIDRSLEEPDYRPETSKNYLKPANDTMDVSKKPVRSLSLSILCCLVTQDPTPPIRKYISWSVTERCLIILSTLSGVWFLVGIKF